MTRARSPSTSSTSSGRPARARRAATRITGYVYNDDGDAAVNVALRIHEIDASGTDVASVVAPVGETVPARGRTYFDVAVPRSRFYRVDVSSFDFVELTVEEADAMLESRSDLWAVVLAGGDGDSPTLLRHTLDRVARLIPPSQTVAVTQASQAAHVAVELAGHPAVTVLAQPCDRGSAAGVLLAAHWIRSRAPGAVVAVFPTNHFIVEESLFMSHVAAAGAYVRGASGGAAPAGRAPDRAGARPRVDRARRAARLDGPRRGPSGPRVPRAPARGARAPAARTRPVQHLRLHRHRDRPRGRGPRVPAPAPRPAHPLRSCSPARGTRPSRSSRPTSSRPTADFSRAILASAEVPLAVAEIPALTWWDLGTPERVARGVGVGAPRE